MEPLSYLHLQMRLEGKEVIDHCFIRQVEQVPNEELPLMLMARFINCEQVAYFDESISPDLHQELSSGTTVFPNIDRLLAVLKSHHIPFEMGHYKTYVFASQPIQESEVLCLPQQDARVKAFGFNGFASKVYAVERDGVLASACVSTLENAACGEGWVYTAPEYRKQGLAQKAVRGWATDLMYAGKVPFYSHKIENVASANLAKKLGLLPVYEEISITQM